MKKSIYLFAISISSLLIGCEEQSFIEEDISIVTEKSAISCLYAFEATPDLWNGASSGYTSKTIKGTKIKIKASQSCIESQCEAHLYKGATLINNASFNISNTEGVVYYNYQVPSTLANGSDYHFESISCDGGIWAYNASVNFTVTSSRSDWMVTPNASDVGDSKTLNWNASYEDYDKNVKLSLYNSSNSFISTITSSTSNDGAYAWTIPSSITTGSYKVKVETVGDSGTNDFSGTFTITAPITVPVPVIIYPSNGSVILKSGFNFRWDNTAISSSYVYLVIKIDGVTKLKPKIYNDGIYTYLGDDGDMEISIHSLDGTELDEVNFKFIKTTIIFPVPLD